MAVGTKLPSGPDARLEVSSRVRVGKRKRPAGLRRTACVAGALVLAVLTLSGLSPAGASAAKPFGYNEPSLPYGDWWNRLTSASAATEGAQGPEIVRIGIPGCPGFHDWDEFVWNFTRASQLGLKIVLVPGWSRIPANPGDGHCYGEPGPPKDDQAQAWRAFVKEAVNRASWYAGAPLWVEVWNEPNLERFWGGPPDPSSYASAFWWAWQGVQDSEAAWRGGGVNLNFPVMLAGPGRPASPCPGNAEYMCVRDFLERVRGKLNEWGALNRVEMTGAHLYPESSFNWPTDPGKGITRTQSLDAVRTQWSKVRDEFPGPQTFITEAGVRERPYGQFYQCDRLLDIYNWMASKPEVAGLAVFRLFDGPSNEPLAVRSMGTIAIDGTPKAAYWWLRYRNQGWSQATTCTG